MSSKTTTNVANTRLSGIRCSALLFARNSNVYLVALLLCYLRADTSLSVQLVTNKRERKPMSNNPTICNVWTSRVFGAQLSMHRWVGAAGLAVAVAGGAGMAGAQNAFHEPPVFASHNGTLDILMTAKPNPIPSVVFTSPTPARKSTRRAGPTRSANARRTDKRRAQAGLAPCGIMAVSVWR